MTRCEHCNKRIWFWQCLLWQQELYPCPYCNKIIINPNYTQDARNELRKMHKLGKLSRPK